MFKKLLTALLAFCAMTAFAAIDVNKASQAELEGIKGIGPALSTRILDERKKAAFKDWAEMAERVKGIGEGNSKKFSAAGLTVNGASYQVAAKAAKASGTAAPAAKAQPAPVKPVAATATPAKK